METKRFSKEDLASGMPGAKAQAGKESSQKEQNQEAPKTAKQGSKLNTGKRYSATAGIVAGGAAVAAAAVAGQEYLDLHQGEELNEDNLANSAPEQSAPINSEEQQEPKKEPEDVQPNEIDTKDGMSKVVVEDIDGDGVGDEIHVKIAGDSDAEIVISSENGDQQMNHAEIDLDGDGQADIILTPGEDGAMSAQILNEENVVVFDPLGEPLEDSNSGDPVAVVPEQLDDPNSGDPVAVVPEPLDDPNSEDPISVITGDPEELLDEEPVIPSDIDENGNLLAEGGEDGYLTADEILYETDSTDEMEFDFGTDDVLDIV